MVGEMVIRTRYENELRISKSDYDHPRHKVIDIHKDAGDAGDILRSSANMVGALL